MAAERGTVPRGRHAPPLEVRLEVQRERLFEAAAAVFARSGYAEASAESISREAGMSKATFYEHFANKEECILALFDEGARTVLEAMAEATATATARACGRSSRSSTPTPRSRRRSSSRRWAPGRASSSCATTR